MTEIELPLIKLRPYQREIWDRWFEERQEMIDSGNMRVRLMSQEWHRRCGKDLFDLNIIIAEAMLDTGNYWFVLPESQQVRNAIWEGITSEGTRYLDFIPEELIYKKDNQSMKIHLRHPIDPTREGSIISFLGGDRYDKRVGAGLKGCVISEHSLQKPNLFDLAIEPMIKETKGFCIFNFTPRGENHATRMWDYLHSKPDKYIASRLTIKDTGMVKEVDLQEERERGKPEELIQQEYYCDRSGAVYGSYYGDVLKANKDKFGEYPYDSGFPVHTFWDLGISDQMAIWFVQFRGTSVYLVDYYENSNYALGHYADICLSKGFMYARHHLPHDGNHRELTSGERAITVQQQLMNLGLRPIQIHPKRMDLYGVIQRVRSMLSKCYFNVKTKDGYEALKQYAREFDENRQIFKNTPLHNWASHGADAFSLIPMAETNAIQQKRPAVSKQFKGTIRIKL